MFNPSIIHTNTHCTGAVTHFLHYLNCQNNKFNGKTVQFLYNTYEVVTTLNKTTKSLPTWPNKTFKQLYEPPICNTSRLDIYRCLLGSYFIAYLFGFEDVIGYINPFLLIALRDYHKLLSEPKYLELTDRNTLRQTLKVKNQKNMETIEKILYVLLKGMNIKSGRWSIFSSGQRLVIIGLLYVERLRYASTYRSTSRSYTFDGYNRKEINMRNVLKIEQSEKQENIEQSEKQEKIGKDNDSDSDLEIMKCESSKNRIKNNEKEEQKQSDEQDVLYELPESTLVIVINQYQDPQLIEKVMNEMDRRECMFDEKDDQYNLAIFQSTMMGMDWD